MGGVLRKPYRGLSPLVFDLPPNPSIDRLVAVILKYPRREESGQRKSLNPDPMGQRYTGSRIWSSENTPSTHSGEWVRSATGDVSPHEPLLACICVHIGGKMLHVIQ